MKYIIINTFSYLRKISAVLTFIIIAYCTPDQYNLSSGELIIFLDREAGYSHLYTSQHIKEMSLLDFSLRMKKDFSDQDLDCVRTQYNIFLEQQIKNWAEYEKIYLLDRLEVVADQLGRLNTRFFPDTLLMISTTGRQEFKAFYTTGNAIVFTKYVKLYAGLLRWVSPLQHQLESLLAHELFHIYTTNHSYSRNDLYSLVGFSPIDSLQVTGLENLLITNPDDKGINYRISLIDDSTGQEEDLMLLITSKFTTWVGYNKFPTRISVLFGYMEPKLIKIKQGQAAWQPEKNNNGSFILSNPNDWLGFTEKTGINASSAISPEEILAHHFENLIKMLWDPDHRKDLTSREVEILMALEKELSPTL